LVGTRNESKKETYTERYHHTKRTTNLETLSSEQKAYIVKLRDDNPNMGYKRFYNKHLQPKLLATYKDVFKTTTLLSKHDFYAILTENGSAKHITKRQKRTWISERYKKY
jgi:hypothetical protein